MRSHHLIGISSKAKVAARKPLKDMLHTWRTDSNNNNNNDTATSFAGYCVYLWPIKRPCCLPHKSVARAAARQARVCVYVWGNVYFLLLAAWYCHVAWHCNDFIMTKLSQTPTYTSHFIAMAWEMAEKGCPLLIATIRYTRSRRSKGVTGRHLTLEVDRWS